jgi:hypothetical protein
MTRREFLVASLVVTVTPRFAFAQREDFFTGKDVFANLMAKAKADNWAKLTMGEVVGKVGMSLVGTPYLGQTFEVFDSREVCVINLKGLDCATFYEASLALARTIKSGRHTEGEFEKQVTRIRYRTGRMNGYISRLHYSSDYFFDNEKKGILNVISDDIPGAELFTHKVSYMSKNPDQYRQLKANAALVPAIAKTEEEINGRRTFYVPADKVADIEILLKTGDIIGLTTPLKGLDVSHTGVCYRDEKGVLRLLHASSSKKQVVLDVRLSDYLKDHAKVNDGIMVARPLEL